MGLLLGTTALITPALAEPDSCSSEGDNTYLCKGDQSGGFIVGTNSGLPVTAQKITVEELTDTDVTYTMPFIWSLETRSSDTGLEFFIDLGTIGLETDSGGEAIRFINEGEDTSDDGDNLALDLKGAVTNKSDEPAVLVISSGKHGADGEDEIYANGHGGHVGGSGGNVALILNYTSSSAYSILEAQSGENAIQLSSEGNYGGKGGKSGIEYDGGSGGAGGSSGTIRVENQGAGTDVDGTINIASIGGYGGEGGSGSYRGGSGGTGGVGGDIFLDLTEAGGTTTGIWGVVTSADGFVLSTRGGDGGNSGGSTGKKGEIAGTGGASGTIEVGNATRTITLNSGNSTAFSATARGGDGGAGGGSEGTGSAADAGAGGDSGSIYAAGAWKITGSGSGTLGLDLKTLGGAGGKGGSANEASADGGAGGTGGGVGGITLIGSGEISVTGAGIQAYAYGGDGGEGGNGGYHGGSGGAGGDGGAISLEAPEDYNPGWTVSISDTDAYGFDLQSIGGAGGNSGGSTDADGEQAGEGGDGGDITGAGLTFDINLNGASETAFSILTQGGAGGAGGGNEGTNRGGGAGLAGAGGKIAVEGTWTISGSQSSALGIYLRNFGGAGGKGGNASSDVADLVGKPAESGADGGASGEIGLTVQSGTFIDLSGSGSTGIRIESLTGQGGDAGSGGLSPTGTDVTGGNGGDAAGDIFVVTEGTATVTAGTRGILILSDAGAGGAGNTAAEAVKGGTGGTGGASADTSLNINSSGADVDGSWVVTTTDASGRAIEIVTSGGAGGAAGGNTGPYGSMTVYGGDGGAGGDAGSVAIGDASHTLATSGSSSIALAIVSNGGAGAEGGGSDGTIAAVSGGDGGDGGDGGAVEINGSWSIANTGSGSTGISVTNTGGAGGAGGTGTGSPSGGGDGKDGGDGGEISVGSSASVVIETTGTGASFVSQGGAGGDAGTGNNPDDGAVGGTAGNGGAVSVAGDWSITTTEEGAHGLVAKSVGGAGGETGGLGGLVSVDIEAAVSGNTMIATSGAGAHGIVAVSESQDPHDTGVTEEYLVSVTVDGDIKAAGNGSHGIYAESNGPVTGVIQIVVEEDATVTGGGAANEDQAYAGAGIFISEGSENTLTNYGTVTSILGAEGTAIRYDPGVAGVYLALYNHGSVIGQMFNVINDPGESAAPLGAEPAGGGTIYVYNQSGGVIEAGARFDANRVENSGRFAPFGDRSAGTTSIVGDYIQSTSGVLAVDINTEDLDASDLAEVGGTADLDGTVVVGFTNAGFPVIGEQAITILTAGDGISYEGGFNVMDSAVARYRLLQSEVNALRLSFDIDFANAVARSALNDNQKALADHLQSVYEAGALDATLTERLILAEDEEAYAKVVNPLSTEISADNQLGTVYSTQLFDDSLLSCVNARPGQNKVRFFDDGQCAFATLEARGFNRGTTSDNLGFTGSSWALAAGGQYVLGEGWNVGGALAYERRHIASSSSSATSNSHHLFAGLSLKRLLGAFEISGSQSVGYGIYDIDRNPIPGLQVSGDQDLWSASSQMRVAYLFERENYFIKPRVDLGYTHVFGSSFTEAGSSAVAFQVETDAEDYWSVQPALEIGGEFTTPNGTRLRPHVTVGLTQFLNDPDPSLTARFASAPSGISGFTNSTSIDTTLIDFSAGIDVISTQGVVFRAGGFITHSRNADIYGGTLRMEIPF